MSAPLPDGFRKESRTRLTLYCDSHDLANPTATAAIMRTARATTAIAMVEGLAAGGGVRRIPVDVTRRFAATMTASVVATVLCAFPRVDGDHEASRAALATACAQLELPAQLDAEPGGPHGLHWSPELAAPWLAAVQSVTSVLWEVGRLGMTSGKLYGQTSTPQGIAQWKQLAATSGIEVVATIEPVRQPDGSMALPPDYVGRMLDAIGDVPEVAVWDAHLLSLPSAAGTCEVLAGRVG